jgi:hypothetical protein
MPQLFGAACFLDTRLTRKLPNRYPSESDTLTQARAGQPSLVAQASIELRLMFRRHQIPRISLANRRGPERAETKPNPRRTNSLQHGCFYSGRIVRQTRTEFLLSGPEGSRGFESAPLRQAVPISRYSPLESPNSARQRLLSTVNGSGENHIPANDARFASKVSAGKFGATVWAGRRKELGRTKGFENL